MDTARITQLLGNELAQNDENFSLYAIKRDDLMARLVDRTQRYIIINAPRGSGKSGLLLKLDENLKLASKTQNIVITKYLIDIDLDLPEFSLEQWIQFWRRKILVWLVEEVGVRISAAEERWQVIAAQFAEICGRRGDRLAPEDFKPEDVPTAMLELIIARSGYKFHLLLDEMDDNFQESLVIRDRLAGLLQACKSVLRVPDIHVRLTIRPHIMTILQTHYDHVQQLRSIELGLTWRPGQLKEILARRIAHFDQVVDAEQFLLEFEDDDNTDSGPNPLLRRYFDDFDMSLEENSRSRFRALHTLSLGRPRWMLEFCALALQNAPKEKAGSIEYKKAMHTFGSNRMKFLAGEHYFHSPDLQAYMNGLASKRKIRFSGSTNLRKAIEQSILGIQPVSKREPGDPILDETLEIARLLYMVEFIRARQKGRTPRDYRFITYAERPSLLASWSVEPTIVWEIHPTFCRALNIVDNETFKTGDAVRIFGEPKSEP